MKQKIKKLDDKLENVRKSTSCFPFQPFIKDH
jgi:hypothetical protein